MHVHMQAGSVLSQKTAGGIDTNQRRRRVTIGWGEGARLCLEKARAGCYKYMCTEVFAVASDDVLGVVEELK